MPEGVVIRRLQPSLRLAIPIKDKPRKPDKWRRLKDYPPPTPQPTPCRLWQGAVDKYGYGKKKVKYSASGPWESEKIHRWVMNMSREVRLRPDQVILHLCDQPLCYRLDHLRVGTIQENNADMLAKGRASKPPVNILLGEKHGMSKLTKAAVKLMREMDEAGASQVEIARAFDVSRTTVRRVLRGLSWTEGDVSNDDVPGPGPGGGSDPGQGAEGPPDRA
jgi:hypothetical protein